MYSDWVEKLRKVVAYLDALEIEVTSRKECSEFLLMFEGLEDVIREIRQLDYEIEYKKQSQEGS